MVYRDRIEIDPQICTGKPVIRGTRILVTSLLSQLAAGESFEAIRRGFPGITDDDIRAAIEFAKDSVDSTELSALKD
ncbi:MAG: DUF433 domain-containing protein [Acidobacteriia bacterium]|nr:DUF433 domain-containing protein [Terriglobia bacterium]